jgi:hypothetical protein
MKLNVYLYEKIYAESRKMFQDEECEPLSADIIEQWIIEWYNESFKAIGCDGTDKGTRMPPMWLANWRKPERSVVEQERCGVDEG